MARQLMSSMATVGLVASVVVAVAVATGFALRWGRRRRSGHQPEVAIAAVEAGPDRLDRRRAMRLTAEAATGGLLASLVLNGSRAEAQTATSIPADGSVTDIKVAPDAKIAATKLALPQLNLRSFGAKGDGVTDDAPALQAAFNALVAAGGGELLIPPGRFVLKQNSYINCYPKATVIRLVGHGSASQLLVKTNTSDAISILNPEHVTVQGVTFIGTPGVWNDAYRVLVFNSCIAAIVRDCGFYGLSSANTGGCIVHSRGSQLSIQDSVFRGSAGSFSEGTVSSSFFSSIIVDNCEFFDYGMLDGVFHSKTPIMSNIAWIKVNSPIRPLENALSQSVVRVTDCRFDEGALKQIVVAPTDLRVSRVHIDGIDANVNGTSLGAGIVIGRTDEVVIERSYLGYASVGPRDAVLLNDVKHARLERLFCLQKANRITADAACQTLEVVECTYSILNSSAAVTNIERDGRGGFALKVKDGPITDADFDSKPPDGTMALDQLNSNLAVRVKGAWRQVALVPPPPPTTTTTAPPTTTTTAPTTSTTAPPTTSTTRPPSTTSTTRVT